MKNQTIFNERKIVSIGDRKIGDGEPCFITYEAGPTHDGVESAKRLITHAAEAGADAIKFQIFDPDKLVADRKQLFSYEVLIDRKTGKTEKVEEPLYDILARRSLTENQWREVKKHSDNLNLAFFATVGFEEDINFLESLGCHSIKIASADVNHFPLLRKVAKTGMCVQIDTGMSTFDEIESAVDVLKSEGNENIIIHQCPSGYPARLDSINLKMIPALKSKLPYPVAFSDHTPGAEMDIAAVAIGANLIEKTITEDRMTRSVEHVMSIEPAEMKKFIKTVRDLEIALGSSVKVMTDIEIENRKKIRRSVFLEEEVEPGQLLGNVSISFRRPGFGVSPDQFENMLKYSFKKKFPAGKCIYAEDLNPSKVDNQ